MNVESITVGQLGTNCYVVYDGKFGIVIDPGDEGEKICNVITGLGIQITTIVLTHAHFDHMGAVDYISQKFNCKLALCKDDYEDYINPPSIFNFAPAPKTDVDLLLNNGDDIAVGNIKLMVMHTPGHTKGSITLVGENTAFCGDTLFYESIGRTDFPGGDFKREIVSVNQILQLDDNTVLYSGHGPSTTVGHEKKYNPYVGMI